MRPVRAAVCLAWLLLGLAAAPIAAQVACDGVAVRSPFAGTTVRGVVPVLGSADIAGFGFYKVEWAADHAGDNWGAVSTTVARPVRHGQLDSWDTTRLPDGVYRLRLTVVDVRGQEPCQRVVEGLLVANDATYIVSPTVAMTPTLELAAARSPRPAPTTDPPAEPRGSTSAGPDGSATEPGRPSASPGPGRAATAASSDFPIQLAPADEPLVDLAVQWRPIEALDDALGRLGAGRWPRAFLGGAAATILLGLVVSLAVAWRSR